jgi:GAF domain
VPEERSSSRDQTSSRHSRRTWIGSPLSVRRFPTDCGTRPGFTQVWSRLSAGECSGRFRARSAVGWTIADIRGTAALRRLCRQTVVELGLSGVGVTVLTDAGAEVLAASDGDAQHLEELQFVLGEGPTPDAFRNAQPVLVSDLSAHGTGWPHFSAAADSRGVSGVYAFPLQLGGVRLGVCTFYANGERADTERIAEFLTRADAARELLLDSVDGSLNGTRGLSGSVPLRTVVYQAQGMLMVALEISLADALVRLRAMAYAEELDINQLAADLVSGRRVMPSKDGVAE